jgi:5-methylthioribose kinase
LQSLEYSRGSLSVLDQLLLPLEKKYIPVTGHEDAWAVIRSMQVRGAPLIAIVAALGLAVEAHERNVAGSAGSSSEAAAFLLKCMEHLRTSRPTAVNLFVAMDELKVVVETAAKEKADGSAVYLAYIEAAETIFEKDVKTNKSIGDHGAKRILELTGRKKIRVLTICNTGSLATAGYGTALGVVRSLHEMGALEHVYACETRPYNQGARLTAFEIVEDQLPGTLITDSMASSLMARKGIDCVITGADRVTANGDTANKIGTYQLAITAKYHCVPFFAAVPTTTLDLTMASGAEIHIEDRPANELTTIFNQRIAPEGINVWNPSFDVTPSTLIKGVITEIGVIEADLTEGEAINIPAYLKTHGMADRCANAVTNVNSGSPPDFMVMTEDLLKAYICNMSKLSTLLDVTKGTGAEAGLKVSEVGDGNLNFVYIVEGPTGKKIVVKQALPYIRCVGEGWPLTLERASFETNALREERGLCEEHVPEVYHFDKPKALIFMRFVEEPHLILRKAFIQGMKITTFADHTSTFMAKTLYGTSALAMDGGSFRMKVSEWSRNTGLCALTEKVIFTDPYCICDTNHWTPSAQIDAIAKRLREDPEVKTAAAKLKGKFVGSTQALLHGDLHSGSVMVKEGSTFVIDPEFAFYGPMGFDIGAILANMALAFFAQSADSSRGEYQSWLLEQMVSLHAGFEAKFLALWDTTMAEASADSELFRSVVFNDTSSVKMAQKKYMDSLWADSIGFMGMKMIRRIVGIAHVEDLESIKDEAKRAECEVRALNLAIDLVIASQVDPTVQFADISAVAKAMSSAL